MPNKKQIVDFIQNVFQQQNKQKVVVGVSGGIDSAVSLTLFVQSLGKNNVYPFFLPFKNQSTTDGELIAKWNKIPKQNWQVVRIDEAVLCWQKQLLINDRVRLGNLMARMRMAVLFDQAKKLSALVGGTENKSERYLGYFTRFGDQASDIEPISHLFKTEVYQLAQELKIPELFVKKAPSANLWAGQTDERELGFSYRDADKVLAAVEKMGWLRTASIPTQWRQKYNWSDLKVDLPVIEKILFRLKRVAFKSQVPFSLAD